MVLWQFPICWRCFYLEEKYSIQKNKKRNQTGFKKKNQVCICQKNKSQANLYPKYMKQIYTGIGIINRRHDCEYNRSSASSPKNSCVLKGTYLPNQASEYSRLHRSVWKKNNIIRMRKPVLICRFDLHIRT